MGFFGENKVGPQDDDQGRELTNLEKQKERHQKAQEAAKEEHLKRNPGPNDDRHCTDVLFLILFVAFWVGMFVVAGRAVQTGQPERLIYGVDSYGNICGQNNDHHNASLRGRAQDFSHKPFLYFIPNISNANGLTFNEVCVETCPNATHLLPNRTDEIICPYGVEKNLSNVFPFGTCWGTFQTTSVLHRCVPDLIHTNLSAIAGAVSQTMDTQRAADLSMKLIGNMVAAWPYIAISGAVALAISFIWVLLMRWFAGVLVWGTMLAAIGLLTVLTAFMYKEAHMTDADYNSLPIYLRLQSQQDLYKFLKWTSVVLIVVEIIVVFIFLFMFSRIKIAIGLFKETSRAIAKVPAIFAIPLVVALSIVPLAIYWLWIGAYLATSGQPTFDAQGNFDGFNSDRNLRYTQLYHLFGGFWTLNFLHAIGETTIAGAVGEWYWTHDKTKLTHTPVLRSFLRILRYHTGSLLFGSLLLAIIQTIRVVLAYFEHQMKGKENRLGKIILKIMQCVLGCFERFIKFMNENAYVMVAIYGYSFCGGARRGFSLLASNLLRVAALQGVTAFIVFIGKLFVTCLTTLIFFFVLRNDPDVTIFVIPLIIIAIFSYAVSAAFFGLLNMAIKTILLCFCEDIERNDGSAERPYYMSDSLKSTLDSNHLICCC